MKNNHALFEPRYLARRINPFGQSWRFLMKKITPVITLLLICSGVPHGTLAFADPVKIGVMLPLTGHQAPFGQIQKKSVLLAAEEINAGGGVKGKKIELIIADTQGNPDAGRAAILKLIQHDKVTGISGGFSNTATWAAIPIAQKNKIPFLVNSASADKITEQGWEYVFRLNQPASERLDAVASFISTAASDIQSVAIVYENSLEHAADARRFSKKAAELGLKTVIRERFVAGADDFRLLLTRVAAKTPDLIYAVAESAEGAALLVRQLKDLKLNSKLFIGGGNGFVRPDFALHAGKAAEHIVCAARWSHRLPYRGAGAFTDKFIARFKSPPEPWGAEAYAAIAVIADALKRVKVMAPQNVRDALAKTRVMTVLGPVEFVSYNNKSRQNKTPALLVQWLKGQPEIVWPKHLATQKVVYPIPE